MPKLAKTTILSRRVYDYKVTLEFLDVVSRGNKPVYLKRTYTETIQSRRPFTAANRLYKKLHAKGGIMHGLGAIITKCSIVREGKVDTERSHFDWKINYGGQG